MAVGRNEICGLLTGKLKFITCIVCDVVTERKTVVEQTHLKSHWSAFASHEQY